MRQIQLLYSNAYLTVLCGHQGYLFVWMSSCRGVYYHFSATFMTPPDDDETLQNFVNKVNPGGPGWARFTASSSERWPVPKGVLSMILGCLAVYGSLLGTGQFIYGHTNLSMIFFTVVLLSSISLFKLQKK